MKESIVTKRLTLIIYGEARHRWWRWKEKEGRAKLIMNEEKNYTMKTSIVYTIESHLCIYQKHTFMCLCT